MKSIAKMYQIKAPIKKVWKALVDPKIIEQWGAGPAKMSERVGEEFSLWGGDIHGKNIEVGINKKLVQEWYSGNWPEPSIAKFTLKASKGTTLLELTHKDVPDNEAKEIDEGWDLYYLGPVKKLLEE